MFASPMMKALFHFHRKDASYYAAAIAFYLLFSIFPFLLLTLSVAALFTKDSSTFLGVFNDWFAANAPREADPMRTALIHVFEHRGQLGVIGLIWICLAAKKLLNAIEIGLNAVLEIEKPKSGVLSAITSAVFVFVMALLFLATVLVTIVLDLAFGMDLSFLGTDTRNIVTMMLKAIFSGVVSIGMFYSVYRLAPARGLNNREALLASVGATLMWLTAKHLFIWYGARHVAQYAGYYSGGVSALLALLWAYVFSISLLMGACLVKGK